VIQPLLQRLVEEELAVAVGEGDVCFYRCREGSLT
jgi:hypothetical protein